MLVNNAGYVYGRTFMELPDCEIEQTFKVNILSHYWVSINNNSLFYRNRYFSTIFHLILLQITKSFLKDMMKKNHGHIVTIASVTGLIGTYKCTDYSATKFAAIGCHESLFTELKVHKKLFNKANNYQVTVDCLHPNNCLRNSLIRLI